MSAFRGGLVFPSMFLGTAIGVAARHLPGMSIIPGVGIGIGAMFVSMLKLPCTAVLLATVRLASDGHAVTPLVIVAHVDMAWLPAPHGKMFNWAMLLSRSQLPAPVTIS